MAYLARRPLAVILSRANGGRFGEQLAVDVTATVERHRRTAVRLRRSLYTPPFGRDYTSLYHTVIFVVCWILTTSFTTLKYFCRGTNINKYELLFSVPVSPRWSLRLAVSPRWSPGPSVSPGRRSVETIVRVPPTDRRPAASSWDLRRSGSSARCREVLVQDQ